MLKGKKGQLGDVLNTVLIVVFALVILTVGFLFLQEILGQDNFYEDAPTVTNETNAYANGTDPEYVVARENGAKTDTFVISEVWIENSTKGTGYNFTNATLATYLTVNDRGEVTNTTPVNETKFSNLSITYDYRTGQDSWMGVNETMGAFLETPALIGLVILVVMVAIIIAVLSGWMPGKVGTGA